MTRKVYNVGGGRHSEAALSALLSQLLEGDVARGLNIEPTGSAGLSVRITAGTGQIRVSQFHSRVIQSDAAETTTAVPAPTSNPRRNLVVAYIDPTVTPTTSVVDNTNGVFKFAVIQGAEAATPQIPTNTAVTAALGTENWIPLGDFRTNVGATSVVIANITDQRRMILVTSDKIDSATLPQTVSVTRTIPAPVSTGSYVTMSSPTITVNVPKSGKIRLEIGGYQSTPSSANSGIWAVAVLSGANSGNTDSGYNFLRIGSTQPASLNNISGSRVLSGLNPGLTTIQLGVRLAGGGGGTTNLDNAYISATPLMN